VKPIHARGGCIEHRRVRIRSSRKSLDLQDDVRVARKTMAETKADVFGIAARRSETRERGLNRRRQYRLEIRRTAGVRCKVAGERQRCSGSAVTPGHAMLNGRRCTGTRCARSDTIVRPVLCNRLEAGRLVRPCTLGSSLKISLSRRQEQLSKGTGHSSRAVRVTQEMCRRRASCRCPGPLVIATLGKFDDFASEASCRR
jgi:hypothetical protein